MDNKKVAKELVKVARELTAVKYNYSVEKKAQGLMKAFRHIKPVVERLSKLDSDAYSYDDMDKIEVIYDGLMDISAELDRISR